MTSCYYKGARDIKKWSSQFITKWGNHYYIVGHASEKRSLYYKVEQVLQIGARAVTNWGK